ncbi:MAG: GGDEF domain-containing protein [Candidatus Omnitrophica bacterium]|nr:GGDEF domain-containing protein [Candidatus Omnitrophota bacterium]
MNSINVMYTILVFGFLLLGFIKYRQTIGEMRKEWGTRLQAKEEACREFSEENSRLEALVSEIINKEIMVVTLYEITKSMSVSLKFDSIFSIFSAFLKENFASFRKSELVILKGIDGRLTVDRTYRVCGVKETDLCESKMGYEALIELLIENVNAVYLTREKDELKFVKLHMDKETFVFFAIPLLSERKMVGILTVENLPFDDIERFTILAAQFALEIKKVLLYETVEELAITDGLTELYVRRYFFERLEEELKRSKRHNFKFIFLMIDIDNFKTINDTYGHLVGDVILKDVGRIIKENSREIDLAARYGGEEYSLVLPNTGREDGRVVAERIRGRIEENIFKAYDERLKVTVSVGISVYPDDSSEVKGLVERADKALYTAKDSGKNIVSVYGKPRIN